ncbi:sensor histidine kinase [Spirillospora sp. CA-294931]|uniref:sensor histidine kinase n=1 Tax=Spirillospora sp. CA-294931 TaxID=3240042 RepID=UPI003D92C805
MPDPRLRRARVATLAMLGMGIATTLAMPAIGALHEPSTVRIVVGLAAILAFTLAQGCVLYSSVTPALSRALHRRFVIAFAAASVVSVPLAGPLGAGKWETWAWIGASVVATAPLLAGRVTALAASAAALAASAGVAAWNGDPVLHSLLLTGSLGLSMVSVAGLHVWLWILLVDAEAGRDAQGRLAAAEERLRFARDVHDLLGHDLSVIALKAELAERLAPVAPERAAREAAELRALAAGALADLRRTVHGYRAVDLPAQLDAIERVLRSSGVRCTVTRPDGDLPPDVAALIVPVLREASTNVLRHSTATWCTIDIVRTGDEVRMTVTNDGVQAAGPDAHSSGLRGLADRLAESGGGLRTEASGGTFALTAVLRDAS